MLGIEDAESAEHERPSSNLVIHQVCLPPLKGARQMPGGNRMRLREGSFLRRLYGCQEIEEEFWCNYSVNPDYHRVFESGDLQPVAFAADGSWRAVEHVAHPFFLGLLFLPQRNSTMDRPHPILREFLAAARSRRAAVGSGGKHFAAR